MLNKKCTIFIFIIFYATVIVLVEVSSPSNTENYVDPKPIFANKNPNRTDYLNQKNKFINETKPIISNSKINLKINHQKSKLINDSFGTKNVLESEKKTFFAPKNVLGSEKKTFFAPKNVLESEKKATKKRNSCGSLFQTNYLTRLINTASQPNGEFPHCLFPLCFCSIVPISNRKKTYAENNYVFSAYDQFLRFLRIYQDTFK